MDIEQLKFGFANYLRETKGDEDLKYDPTSDISIFHYAKEFKEYIESKYSSDALNLSSMSIGDILDLEVVNGKLVDPEKLAEEEQTAENENDVENNDEQIENYEEIKQDVTTAQDEEAPTIEQEVQQPPIAAEEPVIEQEVQQSPTAAEEQLPSDGENKLDESAVLDIINSLMEDELFSGAIDQDKNGELSKDELSNFFNAISIYDGDGTNVSLNDLLSAAEDITNNNFNFNITETTISNKISDSMPPIQTTEKKSTPSVSTGASNFGRNNNTIRSNNTVRNISPMPTVEKAKDINNMNYQELETELTVANTDLSEKTSQLEAIQNGSDDVVAPLKEAMEQALSNYTTALENENNKEADKLSEITSKIEEQETKQRENEEQKQNCEDQIDIANKDIDHYDSVIQSCTDAITTLDNQISALNQQLNSIQDNSDDPSAAERYRAFVRQQISNANTEKNKLSEELKNAENAKVEAEEKRDNAQKELSTIEETITQTNEELEMLKKQQADLEQAVFAKNPRLAVMKQNYLDAKEEYTTTRESEITRAKGEITKAQEYVEKVTNKISEVRQKEYDEKYSVVEMSDFNSKNNFDNAIEWAKQYQGKSQSEMQEVFKKMGYPFHYNAWCGDFTRMVLLSQIGEDNLADWFKDCPNLASCPTIQNSAKGNEITDWNKAQPGDIVLFDWADDGRDGNADHVGIVVGYDPETDTLTTIEGNTTGSGGGSCVEVKQRRRSDIVGVYNSHKS